MYRNNRWSLSKFDSCYLNDSCYLKQLFLKFCLIDFKMVCELDQYCIFFYFLYDCNIWEIKYVFCFVVNESLF